MTEARLTRVGFAGLGRMGAAMATNVAGAGFEVGVWNRTVERSAAVAAETGATVYPSPRALAERSDVVATMLADDDASQQVHHGTDGLFAADGGARFLVEMGTLSPHHVRGLAAAAGDRTVIDAPVSGSIDAARDAGLMIMVGADEPTIEPIRSVLAAMSHTIICLGAVGTGATMKLAVNMAIHGLNQTIAESLCLAEAAGIPPATAYRVFEESAVAAPMLTYRKPQYLDEAANPVSFALSLARKDVALAIDLATEFGVPVPQTELNLDQLRAAEAAGYGDRDMASMVGYVRGPR